MPESSVLLIFRGALKQLLAEGEAYSVAESIAKHSRFRVGLSYALARKGRRPPPPHRVVHVRPYSQHVGRAVPDAVDDPQVALNLQALTPLDTPAMESGIIYPPALLAN